MTDGQTSCNGIVGAMHTHRAVNTVTADDISENTINCVLQNTGEDLFGSWLGLYQFMDIVVDIRPTLQVLTNKCCDRK